MTPTTPPPYGTPPTVSQTEAARRCGVAPSTIRRARLAGRLPGATEAPGGGWRIPIPDLVAAGLLDGATPPDPGAAGAIAQNAAPRDGTPDLAAEVTRLQADLADMRRRAEVAEARAEERAETIAAQAMALRMLEAAPATRPADEAPAPAEAHDGGRRRWWRFGR